MKKATNNNFNTLFDYVDTPQIITDLRPELIKRSTLNMFNIVHDTTYNTKEYVIMRDIICKHHPEFVNSKALRTYGLKHSGIFNVTRLVEETLAHLGNYTLLEDDAHADFSDGTDSKTASIRVNPTKPNASTHAGEISGVTSIAGSQKAGDLRCTIFNPHGDDLRYYYLPKKMWSKNITYHPTSGVGKIVYTYNTYKDTIPKLEGYECDSFKELATL